MRALITGGAGFIGSHLAEHLLARGHEVFVLDDMSTGARTNIAHLVDLDAFDWRLGSAAEPSLLTDVLEGADCIFHLAAAVGVRLIVERPVHTIETNVGATKEVLRAAVRGRIPVLLTSTSEVYGKGSAIPFREDDDLHLGPTTHSRWAYACSKALDEWLALAYMQEKSVPVVIARLFNTVGPRQLGRYGMVLPTFVEQALKEDPITVFGDGEQTRTFAHVRDVVEGLVILMEAPEARGRVINVGSSREVSINSLAAMVKERSGSASPIEHIPYEEAYASGFEDMRRRVPDVTRLKKVTAGFRCNTPLEAIVDVVIEEQRARLEG